MVLAQASTPRAPQSSQQQEREKRLQVLIIGQELCVETLELLLSTQKDLKVISSLVDHTTCDTVLALERRLSHPIDVILIDWDRDSTNSALLTALAAAGQRCLILTSRNFPSDLAVLQHTGMWGSVSTRASSRQLITAIRHVARGKYSFQPAVMPIPKMHVKRRLVFYKEILEAYAQELDWELTPIEIQILAHLYEPNAKEIGAKIDREPGTIRTALSTNVFKFLQRLSGAKIDNQKIAFQVATEFGIFAYL